MEKLEFLGELLIQEIKKEKEQGYDVRPFVHTLRKELYHTVRPQPKRQDYKKERRMLGELLYALLSNFPYFLSCQTLPIADDMAYITTSHNGQIVNVTYKTLHVKLSVVFGEGEHYLQIMKGITIGQEGEKMPEEDVAFVLNNIRNLFVNQAAGSGALS